MQQEKQNTQYKVRINGYIRASQVQVIDQNGTNLGTMELFQAIKLAKDVGLDLIEINPKALPPICRIADNGKLLYQSKKKTQANKKAQKSSEQKQLEMTPATSNHDLDHKMNRAKEFLAEGCRVRILCKFKGRQLAHREVGQERLEYCLEQLKDLIGTSSQIMMEGRDMSVIVSPKSSK